MKPALATDDTPAGALQRLCHAIDAWIETLDCAPSTAKGRAIAARQFVKWAAEQGCSPADAKAPEVWQKALTSEGGLRRRTVKTYAQAAASFQTWLAGTMLRLLEEDLANPRTSPKALREAPDAMLTEALCLRAVRAAGQGLEFVPERFLTPAVCLAAVRRTPGALRFVPEAMRTAALCGWAVAGDGAQLALVPEAVLSEKLCLAALRAGGCSLAGVPARLRTAAVCILAVQKNGINLAHVPGELRTRSLCLAALARGRHDNWAAIPFVPKALLDDPAFCREAAGPNAVLLPPELKAGIRLPEPEPEEDGGEDDDDAPQSSDVRHMPSGSFFVPPVPSGPAPERPMTAEELASCLTPMELSALKALFASGPCPLRDPWGNPMSRAAARHMIEQGLGPGAGLFSKSVLHWTLGHLRGKKWMSVCSLTSFGLAVFAAAVNGQPRRWRGAKAEAARKMDMPEPGEEPAAPRPAAGPAGMDAELAVLRFASRHPERCSALKRAGMHHVLATPFAKAFWSKLLAWGSMAAPMLEGGERRLWNAWRSMPGNGMELELKDLACLVSRELDRKCHAKLSAGVPEEFGAIRPGMH